MQCERVCYSKLSRNLLSCASDALPRWLGGCDATLVPAKTLHVSAPGHAQTQVLYAKISARKKPFEK